MALQSLGALAAPLRRASLKWRCHSALFASCGDEKSRSLCAKLLRGQHTDAQLVDVVRAGGHRRDARAMPQREDVFGQFSGSYATRTTMSPWQQNRRVVSTNAASRDNVAATRCANLRKFPKASHEFSVHIAANAGG